MRMCSQCKRAENPLNPALGFREVLDEVLCDVCFQRFDLPSESISGLDEPVDKYVVITCPRCWADSNWVQRCKTCCKYGVVRIAKNCLPVYRPGNYPELESRDHD